MRRNYQPWLAFIIGILIFVVARQATIIPGLIAGESVYENYSWLKQVSLKTVLIVISFIGTLIITRGQVSLHGYKMPVNMKWWNSIWPGLLIGAIGTVLIIVTPAKGMSEMMSNDGSPALVPALLLYSSISEEIHARAFVQSIVSNLNGKKINLLFTKVSVPTFTSGLLFGCLHFTVFIAGSDIWTTAIIMCDTFTLGLVAGYLFEKYESVVPAIVVHIAGNVGGVGAGIIINIVSFVTTGEFLMHP